MKTYLRVNVRRQVRPESQIGKTRTCVRKCFIVDNVPVQDVELSIRHGIQIPQNNVLQKVNDRVVGVDTNVVR